FVWRFGRPVAFVLRLSSSSCQDEPAILCEIRGASTALPLRPNYFWVFSKRIALITPSWPGRDVTRAWPSSVSTIAPFVMTPLLLLSTFSGFLLDSCNLYVDIFPMFFIFI